MLLSQLPPPVRRIAGVALVIVWAIVTWSPDSALARTVRLFAARAAAMRPAQKSPLFRRSQGEGAKDSSTAFLWRASQQEQVSASLFWRKTSNIQEDSTKSRKQTRQRSICGNFWRNRFSLFANMNASWSQVWLSSRFKTASNQPGLTEISVARIAATQPQVRVRNSICASRKTLNELTAMSAATEVLTQLLLPIEVSISFS